MITLVHMLHVVLDEARFGGVVFTIPGLEGSVHQAGDGAAQAVAIDARPPRLL